MSRMSSTIKGISRNIFHEKERNALLSRMDAPIWAIHNVVIHDDSLDIDGFALPFRGSQFRGFTLNDQGFDTIIYPLETEVVGRRFWYVPAGKKCGFHCRSENLRQRSRGTDTLAFKCEYDEELSSEQNYCVYYCLNERVPLPPVGNRFRVHGNDNVLGYLMEGYSAFVKLEKALQEQLGLEYKDFHRILDWGCGSGRMGRYFHGLTTTQLTGVDIDSDNVRWCSQNLRFGHFQQVPLHPPTALSDSSFDLLIGLSVFTHLGEKVQFEWLRELQRISAKSAVLLMTFHGNTSLCHAGVADRLVSHEKSGGFLDIGASVVLKGFVDDEEYYRRTYHSVDYVMKHWSEFFEIVSILPGYIGNNQDLVIMRKR
jgi:SAM-dependent methyltransferase